MSLRAFLVLLAVTVVSVALAAWAVMTRDVPVASLALDRPFLPDLAARVEEVAEISVQTAQRTMTARRTADGWVLVEAGDYPVDPEQVRGIVLGLAELRLVEAKTDNPQKLARLELEPVTDEGAKSRLVTLRDTQGRVLAEVVLGKRKFSLYGPGKAGMYVREADSHQAWLADRAIDIPDEPLDWLERKILELPKEQIAEIVLQPETPEAVILRRSTPEQKDFVLVGRPDGREVDGDKIDRIAGVFATLSMTDVARAQDKPLPQPIGRALFRTFEGPEVEVWVSKVGEGDDAEWWLSFAARDGKPHTVSAAAGSGEATAAGPATPKLDVAALQKRWSGRVFKVSRYVAERFTWKREDLLKPAAEAQSEGAS
jgi:hypothetical protein